MTHEHDIQTKEIRGITYRAGLCIIGFIIGSTITICTFIVTKWDKFNELQAKNNEKIARIDSVQQIVIAVQTKSKEQFYIMQNNLETINYKLKIPQPLYYYSTK